MKTNKIYKFINIIFSMTLVLLFITFIFKTRINCDFNKIIFNLIFFLLLMKFNKNIRYKKLDDTLSNDVKINVLFIIINFIINMLYFNDIKFLLLFTLVSVMQYYIIKRMTDNKTALNSLIIMSFLTPQLYSINILATFIILLILLLNSFIKYENLNRKYVFLICFLIGNLIGFIACKDFSFILIATIPLLTLLSLRFDKNSIEKFISVIIGILFYIIFAINFLNISANFDFIKNMSYEVNDTIIIILILLLINSLHMIMVEDRNKFSIFNFSLIFLLILPIDSNVLNYVSIIIILLSDFFVNYDMRNYTNIYIKHLMHRKVKNPKKVSVVIPNYNYENYIIERIDSVLKQTYPIYELIILDDKSTDNSIEVIKNKLEKVKKEYPDLIVKFLPNKTNSGNVFKQWNKTFEKSTGDYLWIAEADDSCSNYFLENIMKPFDDEKVIMSYCESLTMDENNKILMRDLRKWIDLFNTKKWNESFIENGKKYAENYICINNTIANVSSLVFKKINKINYSKYLKEAEKYKLAGDWYFYEKILKYGSIAYNKYSLNYHRMHSNSVTLTTKREKEYKEIISIQNDIIKNYNVPKYILDRVKQRNKTFKLNYEISDKVIELSKYDLKTLIKNKKIKDDILLSIIIPVYNTEPYIEKCLNSVLKNIPTKTELIIVNDGSPDNSDKIINDFVKKYPKIIRYYKKKNGGLSNTKNFGLSKAKGKYIGFIDSDDYINSDMYINMLKEALLTNSDIVYCDVEMIYENGDTRVVSSKNYEQKDELLQILDTPLMAASWSKIVKADLFNGIDYPDGYNNEDVAVSPVLFARSKKTSHIDAPFYKYLQRSGSIQNSGFDEKRFVMFYTSKLCFDRIKNLNRKQKEMIKGTIYTNQLLALLIYPISDIKDKNERINLIKLFCSNMNEFKDFDKNKYVKEYLNDLNLIELLEFIKNNDYKKIDKIIRRTK